MDESGGGLDSWVLSSFRRWTLVVLSVGSRWNVVCVFYPSECRILKNDEALCRVDENVRKHIL